MAASDHLGAQFSLYHGTTHAFGMGETVDPREGGEYGGSTPLAYASSDWKLARHHAQKTGAEGKVYEVAPVDSEENLQANGTGNDERNYYSAKGFRVVNQVWPREESTT